MAGGALVLSSLLAVILTATACGRIGFTSRADETDAASADTDAGTDAESGRALAPALARYWINEAATMQGVSELLDDTPSPFPLPLTYGIDTPVFADGGAGGRHLRFLGDEDVGGLAVTSGSKFDRLHQATEATIEMKLLLDNCGSQTNNQRMFGFTNGSYAGDRWFGIRSWNPISEHRVGLILTWPGRDVWTFFYTDLCPDTLNVLHWVVDTKQAQPEDRVRIYQDGIRRTVSFFGELPGDSDWPPMGATIDLEDALGKPHQMYLGRALDGAPRANGERIYYMAVYETALSDTQIADHAAKISSIDD